MSNEYENDAIFCDRCGASMQYTTDDGKKVNISALQISLTMDDDLLYQVLGSYKFREFNFCYRCILELLGVKL